MRSDKERGLLTSRDAGPVEITNRDGPAKFLFLGDHAGNLVPERLAGLGVAPVALQSHIAVDIGISALGKLLADKLDAPFVEQRYSRLVIDCNRALSDAGSIAPESDGVTIPGNLELTPEQRQARQEAIFAAYHRSIHDMLAERDRAHRPTVVISLHSFTPVLDKTPRRWHFGVLQGEGEVDFALRTLALLQAEGDVVVGDNEPYCFDDTDFTVPRHAIASGRPYLELEIRQDLLASKMGIAEVADRLCRILPLAAEGAAPRNY